jgi:dihydrofolate synthase/folylpolyglutamate synthase
MNYKEAIEFIFSKLPMFTRIGAAAYKADLSTTVNLCNALGNPQNSFKAIHIAGTNGKGSVSSFTASILQQSGYKTGLFTSPHLRDFRERIRINGQMIPESYVTAFVQANQELFLSLNPSFFEMSFAIACCYFRDEGVDLAVIETGMGGRLDSTNLVNPIATAITNIGFDHMQFLGNTLSAIAAEKAGIIKPGIQVIIGERNPEIDHVFELKANQSKSPICFAEDAYEVCNQQYSVDTNVLKATLHEKVSNQLFEIESPLPGIYQLKNLVTSLALVKNISASQGLITHQGIVDGIANVMVNTGIMGRWQVLHQNPLAIADTGHNPHGLKHVLAQIKLVDFKVLHIVLGMVSDKDVTQTLAMFPKDAQYYFCRPEIPRGLDVEELAAIANKCGLYGQSYSSVREAFQAALVKAEQKDFIFVGGSTFVVAEVV